MNIQQLEYIVALDNHRHFVKAAEDCNISQPTLSMMVQRLEEELNVKLFDRTKYPIEPTSIGSLVLEQARITLKNINQIKEVVDNERESIKGNFRLGIIPTIAPYLVPELLQKWHSESNEIELKLRETTTDRIIEGILSGTLDGGLLAGPIRHPYIDEYPIYYEKFYAYVSKEDIYKCKEIDLEQVDIDKVWLLENIHCLRGQVEQLCSRKKKSGEENIKVKYEAGNIETLIHIVDYNKGLTVIPEMFAMGLSEERQDNLRDFKNMTAVREVSLIVSKEYVRKKMMDIIIEAIRKSVPKSMLDTSLKEFVVEL
ncbi:MAG: hydrogen peroxide-inducible genes activator [Paludibacteraceae bacterium]